MLLLFDANKCNFRDKSIKNIFNQIKITYPTSMWGIIFDNKS